MRLKLDENLGWRWVASTVVAEQDRTVEAFPIVLAQRKSIVFVVGPARTGNPTTLSARCGSPAIEIEL